MDVLTFCGPSALAYDIASHEREPRFQSDAPWDPSALPAHLAQRAEVEKCRRRLLVHYYRIGHTLAFPLPLDRRPDAFPPGVPGWDHYPWRIWLAWALEERWQVLHAAWRRLGDEPAGVLLRRELLGLAGWEAFRETQERVGLVTAHLAGCLAMALGEPGGWSAEERDTLRTTAGRLIDGDITPWFQTQWQAADAPPTHNIPVIALTRAAQLARQLDHPLADALDAHAVDFLGRWSRLRLETHYSEGTAYDGYLMDSLTAWLAAHPQGAALMGEHRAALVTLMDAWVRLALPGRADLHPPLGDVEAQMPFWLTAMLRLAGPCGRDEEAMWLVQRVAPARLPAAALDLLMHQARPCAYAPAAPAAGPGEQAASATLRSGYEGRDVLAAVSLPRCAMGHLHFDAGSLVVAWQGRCWITDPGYQQYRPGIERDYTLGPAAHNAPVIAGCAQSQRSPRLLALHHHADGRQHAAIDLAGCYEQLAVGAAVRRDVWLVPPGHDDAAAGVAHWLIVRDLLEGLPPGTPIRTSWHGGADLAWRFSDGHACLDDGRRAVWIAIRPGALEPAGLLRHEGSRGPLTLTHEAAIAGPREVRWWVFACSEQGEPPSAQAVARVVESCA